MKEDDEEALKRITGLVNVIFCVFLSFLKVLQMIFNMKLKI